MFRIAAVVYTFFAPTLMGILVTAYLVADQMGTNYLLLGGIAIAGAVLAAPISWVIANKITHLTKARA